MVGVVIARGIVREARLAVERGLKRWRANRRQTVSELVTRVEQRTAELQVLLDLMPAMVWFKDTNNGILRVNRRAAEAAGMSVEEIEGRPSIEVYPEAAEFYADDLEVIHSGVPKLGVVETLRNRQGAELWIQTDKVPYFDKDGTVAGLVVMAQDITGRIRAEESLRLLGSAVEQSNESITITDAAFTGTGPKIVFVNPAFTKMTGYTAEEALGQPVRMLYGPRTDEAVLNRIRQQLERGDVCEAETINYRKGGEDVSLESHIAPIRSASGLVTHLVAIQRDITVRKQTENALRESDAKFQLLTDHITDAFWIRSPDMRELYYVSPAFERIWGRSVDSLYSNPHQWTDFIVPEDRGRVLAEFASLTRDTASIDIQYRIARPDGEIRLLRVRGFQVRDAAGLLIRHTGIVTDITELLQSQKMETVGKLAGGVAHEFNSILTAILGESELLLGGLSASSPLTAHATEINKAARRAATLTRQLLAYGRKQILQPEVLDLNAVLAGMTTTVRLLMGRGVDVRIVPGVGLKAVKADASQLEQVIMNMVMNAADAMPKGGMLTLETANVTPDQVRRVPGLKTGEYVRLTVTDTGTGMSEDARERAFEPFFSTKPVGQGTGLGLATCFGIIHQSGGHISVSSKSGEGSTFTVYLPQSEPRTTMPVVQRREAADLPSGTATVLLVEADPTLREMAAAMLRRLGYTVVAAADAVDAVTLADRPGLGPVDVLFTDADMPLMSGAELSERVRASSPRARVIFASAHAENGMGHRGTSKDGASLLQRPFTPTALARKIRDVLDQPDAGEPETVVRAWNRPGDRSTT